MEKIDEKLKAEREQRRQFFSEWEKEASLPIAIGEYVFELVDIQQERVYYAFQWRNKENDWKVQAIFDEETMDFMIKIDLRFICLTEIEVISGDFKTFRRNVERWTPDYIKKELIHRERISRLLERETFITWEYDAVLPTTVGEYVRIIEPKRPLSGLNGSYVILAYECMERASGILFFYNMYREEYYGELRKDGMSIMIHQYDAKTIEVLARKIAMHLETDLEELSSYEMKEA